MLDATMSEDLYSIKVLIRGKIYCHDIMGYGNFETYQFCADPVRKDEKTNWVIIIKSCVSVYLLNPK